MNCKTLIMVPVALLLLVLMGCPNSVLAPDVADDQGTTMRITTPIETDPVTGVTYETGVLGPGAQYEIWVPWTEVPPVAPMVPWNRCLVIYAHGYANPLQPVALTEDWESMLPVLLANGYAVAHSSYSENGWAVKDGAIRTRQLRGYFADAYGAPAKAYLVGASEGAMISIMLAEKNPDLFSGALCIGGPLGGAEMEVKYIYNVRILFDYFFRNELGIVAGLAEIPDEMLSLELLQLKQLSSLAAALQEALGESALDAHPTESPLLSQDGVAFAGNVVPLILALFQMGGPSLPKAAAMASTVVLADAEANPVFNWPVGMIQDGSFAFELAATIAGGLWYNIYATEDILGRTHGHVPIDNTRDEYFVPGLEEPLAVERLVSRPDAKKYLEHWYQTTGKLSIPVVILHTERDPIVPVAHVSRYLELAAASGSSSFLTPPPPLVLPNFGHCQVLRQEAGYDPNDPTSISIFAGAVLGSFNILLSKTGMPPLVVAP